MHLHTERKKTFQFLDLIHQTKCALNFNKLLNYKPQQHSTPIRGWLLLLLLLQDLVGFPLWDIQEVSTQ